MADWFEGAGNGAQVSLDELLADGAGAVLARIVDAGALLSMGLTSDGGALSVTVTLDGRWRRDYFRTPAELREWLTDAAVAVESGNAARPASSGPRRRKRGA